MSVRLEIRLPSDLLARLRAVAEAQGQTVAAVARDAVRREVVRREREGG